MQQSMTGYGKGEYAKEGYLITFEIKTLNSKFIDFSPRLPKELIDHEAAIRMLVTDRLKRGKVMLSCEIEDNTPSEASIEVDETLFKAYYQKFLALGGEVGAATDDVLKIALQAPDVIKQQEATLQPLAWEEIKPAVEVALDKCIAFRKSEGLSLADKLSEYAKNIKAGLEAIASFDEKRTTHLRAKLDKSIDEIRDKVKVDENRFEQELIFYLERLDISEEKVRLAQHLAYFDEIISKEAMAGKKLGFISQEIGREINTIGSKANDADIQRAVVGMKDELEKIKEQVLNII